MPQERPDPFHMSCYLLAIDIGSSGIKLLLLPVGEGAAVSKTLSYKTTFPQAGWAEQHPNDWWNALCDGLPVLMKEARVAPEQICGVGVDGISWTPVVLDKQGNVLCEAPLWYDTRAVEETRQIAEFVGEEAVFEVSGNPLQAYYTLPKLMWLRKHNERVRKNMQHVLTSNGYIVYRLTGRLSQDECQAYGWPFYNTKTGCYDEGMAERLDFDLDWLMPPCPCAQIIGTVTGAAAKSCGLHEGTPVIAGGLDAACGALGVGVFKPGPVHEQSGSAGGMSICTDHYQPAKGLILGRHVVPNHWLVQGGTVGGGAALNWLCDVLSPHDNEKLKAWEAGALAQSVSPGADGLLFLPYLAGERSPIWNPNAKGVLFGLDYSKTSAHLARAVMESAAFALRHNIETAQTAGIAMNALRAAGGAAESEIWMQIKADITGYPIQAVEDGNATAVGCAILAGVGVGKFSSYDQACAHYVRLRAPYYPRGEYKALYDEQFERYLRLYQCLEPLMKGGD